MTDAYPVCMLACTEYPQSADGFYYRITTSISIQVSTGKSANNKKFFCCNKY